MIFKTAIASSVLFFCLGAYALKNSPLVRHAKMGTGFGAPTISGKDNVSPVSEGDIVYDSLDNIFFGYSGTTWNALSVGVASGTSSYHLPTKGQIVYDTAAGTFKGYNGTTWITFNSSSAGVPAGTVVTTAATTCAAGYIAADGSSVLRTGGTECGGSGCDNLFAAIGTTYGSADGSHFTLPNAQGVFVRGAGSQTIGSVTYSATQGTIYNDTTKKNGLALSDPGHHHEIQYTNNGTAIWGYNTAIQLIGSQAYSFNTNISGQYASYSNTDFTGITMGSGDSETRPANIVLNYCIAY